MKRLRATALWVILLWVGVSLILATMDQLLSISAIYTYDFAWISAHFSVAARSFSEIGVWKLSLIPYVNNPPMGTQPEMYLNWPPLFPILLSYVFSVFGDSETTAHAFMLLIFIGNTIVLALLVHRCLGRVAAAIAAFVWLTLPVNVLYGHLVWNLHLALFFGLFSILCFIKAESGSPAWMALGCAVAFLGVLTSWEVCFLYPGLVGASVWRRSPSAIRLSLIFTMSAVAAGSLVLINQARSK